MRIIIAGSRDIDDRKMVDKAMSSCGWALQATEIITGGARGVDRLGEAWAHDHGLPLRVMRADWNRYGKIAGRLRNAEMASVADALVAIWDGESPGTKHMMEVARARGLRTWVALLEE